MVPFKRLVRFTHGGKTHYGDLIESNGNTFKVQRMTGSIYDTLEMTDEVLKVNELLCPIERTPIIMCIGLNYKTHAEEAKLPLPKLPAVFFKPADALAGPSDPVYTHPNLRQSLDYEGELCVVIGKDVKDVSETDTMDCVLGYSIGNDVSVRKYQMPEMSGGRFCYAKSFDGFAPIGHTITAVSEVATPLAARITTKVNSVIKQDSNTNDLIFSIPQIISHVSRGTTLRKGTVIMTGTPSGVGLFRNEYLHDGDLVDIEIEGVGRLRNRITYSKL